MRLNCEEAVRQFFTYLDRSLAGEALEDLETHLRECLDCCERLEFSRQVDGFVKARLETGTVPAGLEDRLRKCLANLKDGPGE